MGDRELAGYLTQEAKFFSVIPAPLTCFSGSLSLWGLECSSGGQLSLSVLNRLDLQAASQCSLFGLLLGDSADSGDICEALFSVLYKPVLSGRKLIELLGGLESVWKVWMETKPTRGVDSETIWPVLISKLPRPACD